MGADIDIYAHHFAVIDFTAALKNGEHRSAEDQRASPSDPGFDNQVWFHLPDDFLQCLNVLGEIYEGHSQPGEIVYIVGLTNADLVEEGRVAACNSVRSG